MRFWRAPIFSLEAPKPLFKRGFGAIWAKIWGAPNTDPTTTDPTPHFRPSEFRVQFQVVKVPIFGGFPPGIPTEKATASKLF